ncbi:MAG: tail fiber domain-containing protein [Candidatus Neomarinimicrobiota bacterium]
MNGITNVFPQDGNVGIGTASPSFKLDVGGFSAQIANATHQVLTGSLHPINLAGGSTSGTFIKGPASAHLMFGIDGNDSQDSYSVVGRQSATADYSTIFHVRANGTIGIGTAAPTNTLDVRGKIRNDYPDDIYDVWIQGGSASSGDDRNLAILGNTSWDQLILNWGGEYTNGTAIQSKLAVGTTTPVSNLQIVNNVAELPVNTYDEYQILLYKSGTAAASYGLGISSSTMWFNTSSQFAFYRTGSIADMVISNGNVGIGTSSPGRSMHIIGPKVADNANSYSLRLQLPSGSEAGTDYWDFGIDNESGDEDLVFHCSVGGEGWIDDDDGAYGHSSDRRLKKNIEPLGSVLPKVLGLKPSTYHMKTEDDSEPKSIGFIAQDVQEVFPDLDIVKANEDYLGLTYEDFSVLAIAAIQEQQQLIDRQQIAIDDLVKRLEALEKQVNN